MVNLQKLMRAIEELGTEELDMLREYIDWRRQEVLKAQAQPNDDPGIGIDAICASIKQTRDDMSKEQITEIKWTTSMLYLKEESQRYLE